MTNSNPVSSTADLSRGKMPLPDKVAEAFQFFVAACRENKVPYEAAVDHALRYKELFHSMQDKFHQVSDELAASKSITRQQREIIRKLEAQLGIDDEL